MTRPKHIFHLALISVCLFWACKHQNPTTNVSSPSDQDTIKTQTIRIDTFSLSTLPSEIQGCSCNFSVDSIANEKGMFIYAYDLSTTAFMKLNGNLIKFSQTEYSTVGKNSLTKFKSDQYEMILETSNVKEVGNKATLEWGSIRITGKSGKVAIITYYGICGC